MPLCGLSLSGLHVLLQDFDTLKLPAPNLNANDTVVCTTMYGRQYYLTIQFVVLAFLVGSQVGQVL